METYHVYVTTADVRGAGTDANVYIVLYGENDDTGKNKNSWYSCIALLYCLQGFSKGQF